MKVDKPTLTILHNGKVGLHFIAVRLNGGHNTCQMYCVIETKYYIKKIWKNNYCSCHFFQNSGYRLVLFRGTPDI